MTTTRMTVTINDVMPQGIATTGETEVRNNIVNKGDVGIEMSKAAGEAGGMAVQLSDRQRTEEEEKSKYHKRKAGPVGDSAKTVSQQRTRAEWYRKYYSNKAVKQRRAENQRKKHQSKKLEMAVDSVMCSDCNDMATKHAKYDRIYKAQEHVKERHAKNKRNIRHSTKAAQQAVDVDGVIKGTKKKRAERDQRYYDLKYL